MLFSARSLTSVLAAVLLVASSSFAFDTPLSEQSVRQAYFLGQRNDETTASFFAPYLRTLPVPDKGPYIAEVEVYTPYVQIIEASRRRSMGYSAQQAEKDYRHRHDKIFVRVRIDFTDSYGSLELYRSAKASQEHHPGAVDQPLPDFYRDFRVGLSQRSSASHEEQWIEPLRILLQPSYIQASNHLPFIPEDLGLFSYATASDSSAFAYNNGNGYYSYPTGWLVWLVYDAKDIASDDASVEVITTDGQHVVVPFDLASLR